MDNKVRVILANDEGRITQEEVEIPPDSKMTASEVVAEAIQRKRRKAVTYQRGEYWVAVEEIPRLEDIISLLKDEGTDAFTFSLHDGDKIEHYELRKLN